MSLSQMMSSMTGHGKAPFMPTMTKVGGATTAQAHSMAMPSSTTQHSRAAPPDSSKKEKVMSPPQIITTAPGNVLNILKWLPILCVLYILWGATLLVNDLFAF